MLLRSALSVVVLALSVVGCGGGEATPDAATARDDAFAAVDAAMIEGSDAPVGMTDAPVAMTDAPAAMTDAPVGMTDAPAAPDAVVVPATWSEVHTALQTHCTPCHVTIGSGGHDIAQSDVMMAYDDSQLAAVACPGVTKGACAAMRVRAGTMPFGGLPEPTRSEVAALLDGWVSAGQPAP